jgi:hypothetical protein
MEFQMMREAFCVLLLAILAFSAGVTVPAQKLRTAARSTPQYAPTTSFGDIEAYSTGSGVFIRWQMSVEAQNFGFNVYRLTEYGKERVGKDIVLGGAARAMGQPIYGAQYTIFDPAGDLNSFYVIQTAPLSGSPVTTNQFLAKYVPDLSAVGFTKNDLPHAAARVEKADLNLFSELRAEVKSAMQTPDPNTQRWIASQPAAKIGVRRSGIYRVTRAQLSAAGFDVNSSPDLWQLYTSGVEQAITVEPNGNYIEFYGTGIDTNESDTRMYYLIAGPTAGRRMAQRGVRIAQSTVVAPSYDQTFVKKERTLYLDSVLNGDAENFFGSTISTAPYNLTFDLSAIDFAVPSCTLKIKFQGISATQHPISLNLNGHILTPVSGFGATSFGATYSIPTSYLAEGANSLIIASTGASNDFSLFDQISIEYNRKHIASQNSLLFFTQNYRNAILDGFTSPNIRVFDISTDGEPVLMTGLNIVQNGATFGTRIPAARGRVFYAVEDSGLLAPASVTANSPSTLSTANHNARFLIISYKNWLPEAQTWAAYRNAPGMSTEVVDVEDIFDEFNYGVLTADSLKTFLQYAKDNWQTPPQYVLLMGDATYDPRDYSNLGFADFVPAKIVTTIFSETASDDWLADFNNDGLAEMAIGRIPARNSQDVLNALAKVTNFEQPANQSLGRGTLFAYDFDPNFDFGAMSVRVRDELPPGTPSTMIDRTAANSQVDLITAMNTGKYLVNYSGHGSVGVWSGTGFFSGLNISCTPGPTCISFAGHESIYTILSCLNGYFIGAFGDGLSERILKAQNGGGVAVWSSTGLTTPDVQELMAVRFYHQIGVGTIQRLGDLILDAKSVLPGNSDVRLSWALLGDPLLKVHPDSTLNAQPENSGRFERKK